MQQVETWLDGKKTKILTDFPGRSRALLVGVWEYDHWPDLPGAQRDFESVRRALREQRFEVEALENPTSSTLRKTLAETVARLHRGDRFLFYYAGHGYAQSHQRLELDLSWIVPADAPASGHPGFPNTAVSLDRLRSWSLSELSEIRQQLFVFDSCFAGELFLMPDRRRRCRSGAGSAEGTGHPFLGGRKLDLVTSLENQPVFLSISAGAADERVPDESIFRQLLVDSLRGHEPQADPDGDGYLFTETELAPFLKRTVRRLSAQTPQFHSLCDTGDYIFRLPRVSSLPPSGNRPCAGDPTAVLAEVFRWETFLELNETSSYLETVRCGLFDRLARVAVARR